MPDIIAPLADEVARCYWLVDTQSGPFRDGYLPEQEAVYEKLFVEVERCRDTSTTCWRPGTLPRYAKEVVIDEWTYLFGMRCDEKSVPERAGWLCSWVGKFDSDFFARLGVVADLFVMHVDGWWEVYTGHDEWQQRLRTAFPQSLKRSSGEVGRPPGEAA